MKTVLFKSNKFSVFQRLSAACDPECQHKVKFPERTTCVPKISVDLEPPSQLRGKPSGPWRILSILGTGVVLITALSVFYSKERNKRCKFIPYDHLRIRTKEFPWGDGVKTLFHHRIYNALPDGYEPLEEDEEVEEIYCL